jgi:hypothetical protein
MDDFKTASFIVFDENGKRHRVACDKMGDDAPVFMLKGDPSLLLKKWRTMSMRIEMYLKGKVK